jgi:hypothetical protein
MNRAVTGRIRRRLFLTRIVNATKAGRPVPVSPDGDQTILARRVLRIRGDTGTVTEKRFDLSNRESMLLTLRPVPFTPIEPADPQIHHTARYTNVYTLVKRNARSHARLIS